MSSDTELVAKMREREHRLVDDLEACATPRDFDRRLELANLWHRAAFRLERLSAIVTDLATAEAWIEVMTDYDASEVRCHFCGDEPPKHDRTCLYRRAREAAGTPGVHEWVR